VKSKTEQIDDVKIPVRSSMNQNKWLSIVLVGVLITGAIVVIESRVALAVVLLEGSVAFAVMASAALAGGWLVRWLGLGAEPLRDRIIIGAGLGIGLLSVVVFVLGVWGLLSKPVAFGLFGILAAAGLLRLILDVRQTKNRIEDEIPAPDQSKGSNPDNDEGKHEHACTDADWPRVPIQWFHWLWLMVCPFLAIALLAASLPPGILWAEEANAYDVLEYHLAVPKHFHEQGQITFLPYNVYSNFPLASEMLSLLMMTLRGDAIEASFMATTVNVILACLFVAAAWLVGRTYSPIAGVLAGILGAVIPWITYLAGIAYVEVGMLAMAMCSLAAIMRAERSGGDRCLRWIIVAGLLAGFACGYKYTAVVLIAMPLILLLLFIRIDLSKRTMSVFLFAAAGLVAFSPWMIRNVANTGNPVFPLAYSVFGAKEGVWDDTLEARWQHAHSSVSLNPTEGSLPGLALRRTIGDMRMGWMLFALAVFGGLVRRDRWTAGLLAIFCCQLIIWISVTHLFARFAVVMVLPMLLLAVRLFEKPHSSAIIRVIVGVMVAGAGWNLYQLGRLYYHHIHSRTGERIEAYGLTDLFVEGVPHNAAINTLGSDAKVMLVGEARTFYLKTPCLYAVVFNRHPLAEARQRLHDDKAILQWLGQQGVTHIYVDWLEMNRLRSTYGFDKEVEPELFARLKEAGLKESVNFKISDNGSVYSTLYELKP